MLTPLSRPTPARILTLLAVAELLGMSPWFAASALGPQLAARWSLSAEQTASLTSIVQLGFVAGTAVIAIFNLADVLVTRFLFAACALGAAIANLCLLAAPAYAPALTTRFATGFFLAGVYPPTMKMMATWFRERRGLAIGTLIGALTIGKATPYLVKVLGGAHVESVVFLTSGAALIAGAFVAAIYREGPFPFPRRPFDWGLAGVVVRDRQTRLAIGGYLGHMWEIYAMWTWLPAFLAASFALGAPTSWSGEHVSNVAGWLAFGAIAIGGLGCVWGGWAAARMGYVRVVTLSMAVSAACSMLIGFLFGLSPWLVAAVAWVWGFFVVADSAQFSSMVTEVAPPHAVGTALTLQTSMGFLLTTATIQLVPVLAQSWGWRWAFPVLALGPAIGIPVVAGWRGPTPAPADNGQR